jgi:hypothetical protein
MGVATIIINSTSIMNQSNTLRALEHILAAAVNSGDRSKVGALVLLETMTLENKAGNIMIFYEILSKAKDEAKSIRNNPKLDSYIKTVDELQDIFAANHVWSSAWAVFANAIESKNILVSLDALANYFNDQNPKIIIEEDLLDKLSCEFTSLCDQILKSNLPKELKRFLSARIESILAAIRRYHIDGTDGLEKAIKSLVSDLVMTENSLEDKDKKNPIFNKVRAWSLGVLIWITPTPYDLIGAVPDIHDFWIPQFEQLQQNVSKVENIISKSTNVVSMQAIPSIFSKESQKMLCSGEEQKMLAPSDEN